MILSKKGSFPAFIQLLAFWRKLQWISKNVSDKMPEDVPPYIYTYIGFSVNLKKCENICFSKNKCILKDTETQDTRSDYLLSVSVLDYPLRQ